MLKRMALCAILAVGVMSAKSYHFTISDPAMAGPAQLAPGDYKVKVDGQQVTLLDNNGKAIQTAAKLQAGNEKFDQTAVDIARDNGTKHIEWIELGGSHDKVVFQQQ